MTTRLRHPARLAVGVAVLLAAIVVLLVVWRAWHVRAELNAAKSAATDLQSALDARDVDRAKVALADFQAHSSAAADQTDGPVWGGLSHLPAVGDDAAAVHTLSSVLDSVSHRGIAPLVDIVQSFDDGKLSPHQGRIPVDRIQELQGPVRESRQTFDRAATQLAGLDPTSYVGPLASANAQIDEIVAKARKTLGRADKVVRLLPSMLGADGPRKYLLVLQNNAEIRSTGGFPGSVFLLEADHGAIELTHPVAGRTFGELGAPVLPLTPAETALFGDRAGTRFVDTNTIPDFPRDAELFAAHWKQRFDQDVDGVVSADPVLLSYLMRATGPVTASGVTLTSDNVVDQLLSSAYLRIPGADAQDAFFREAGAGAFSAVTSAGKPEELLKAMKQGADEGRLLVHSFHTDEQALIAGTAVEGALPEGGSHDPAVGVYLNDRTGQYGSKMSYYLRTRVHVRSDSCRHDTQVLHGRVVLSSSAPSDIATYPDYVRGILPGASRGTEGLVVYLLAPRGGTLGRVLLYGEAVDARSVDYGGRPAAAAYVELPPGGHVTIRFSMRSGSGQTGDARLDVTPGLSSSQTDQTVPSSCP
ncbi:DUF4012 domain-containing protein [Nocardioides sp. LS1]|uniref:DUF4012 domain-containing protein n=1 Tax=Nocardioides sp. LS1 TaxID=1027620 RepID=UPI000F62824C|nr:DUF4012 domain-containing protein [Nocardioides sp. LS1]GCD90647.1 hypothetical protein NLS1_26530 [Nocardioides sp. LS1]